MADHCDTGTDDIADPVPTTPDGIPLVVNGKRLTETQISALREARSRRDKPKAAAQARELGGADRETDPTRYGDWEKAGRAIDFS